MSGCMPPGFGSRPGDLEHFDYGDPVVGCDDPECGAAFWRRVDRCTECGGAVVRL